MKSLDCTALTVVALAATVITGCGMMSTGGDRRDTLTLPSARPDDSTRSAEPKSLASGHAASATVPGTPAASAVGSRFVRPAAATMKPTSPSYVSQVDYVGDVESCAPQTPVQYSVADHAITSPHSCQTCGDATRNNTPHGYAMQPMPCPPGFDPQEYLCDGGDADPNAFVRIDDTIGGLQAEDTIVHYTTEAGDIEVKASNRVCVYAPRFASVRKVTGAVAGGHAIGLSTVDRPVGTNRIEINEGGVMIGETIELGHADVARRIDAVRERNRGVPVESILQPIQNVDVLAVLAGLKLDQLGEMRDEEKAVLERLALAAIAWTIDESVEVAIEDMKPPTLTRDQAVEGLTIYEFPEAGRLQIVKLADRADAKPGETVTFAIRVENVGDSPVEKVTLTDNLTTRLKYVAGSQTASGGTKFSTQPNQADSLQLIWELTDKLRVGESITIRFQCLVR